MRPTTLTECNVMTALCLWEAHLESILSATSGLDKLSGLDRREALDEREALNDFWREREGAYGARQLMIDIAPVVDRIWDREETDGITFDWEFCPAFLDAFQKLAKGADFTDAHEACDLDNPAALALIDKAASFAITLCAINL